MQQRRTGILAGQHETPGLDEVKPERLLAGVQIIGVAGGQFAGGTLLEGLLRLPERRQPACRQGLQLGAAQLLPHLLAPLLVVQIQQRQIQQPLPGIIHQIHIEGGDLPQVPTQRMAGAITDLEAYLGHPRVGAGQAGGSPNRASRPRS